MSGKSVKNIEGQIEKDNADGAKNNVSPTVVAAADQSSQQEMRAHPERNAEVSSLREISIIETMTSFLEANGAAVLDQEILRNMAETLAQRINDTSPGTLQDVTMEHSYGVGYRSPCVSLQQYHGSTSPAGQGRSVREFEEQMATLRKENFNLKLRLYFIEESIPGYHQANAADGQEAFSKQLIEAKVEMEMLRKEIQEKQEILKEAAQAMNQMEKIQKDTETKSQAMVDELKQKIQYLEMEREMKPNSGDLMNNLLGLSNISENMNALQRLRELEGLVRQSDDRISEFQSELSKLSEMLSHRDETIKEYEDKVKELVFQNAELLESLENKEKEVANAERILRGLRQSNAHLKEDNINLSQTLKNTQDKFCNEITNMKMYERQMRDQQETLSKMQSTIAIKTQNTARLLERIQDYEKMVTKMNFERNLVKRENRFFRAIIGKLQSNKTECYTIEKEIYQQIGSEYTDHSYEVIDDKKYDVKARGDYQREYKLKEKLCLNYCNHCHISSGSMMGDSVGSAGGDHIDNDSCCGRDNGVYVSDYQLHGYCDGESDMDPEIPIRYTISDVSLYGGGGGGGVGNGGTAVGAPMSKTNSCSSLHANISSTSFLGGSRELPKEEIFIKSQRLRAELQERKTELADKTCQLQDAEEQLQNREQIHEQACRTIQKLMVNIKSQQDEINRLKNAQQQQKMAANISAPQMSNVTTATTTTAEQHNNKERSEGNVDFACTGLCRSMSDTEAFSDLVHVSQRQKLESVVKQQEATIENFKSENKKLTTNLQKLVNKELWEKNREIERLNKLLNNKQLNATSPTTPPPLAQEPVVSESQQLQQSFSDAEYAKAVERNKLLQRKVDILIQRLSAERSNEALLLQLRGELRDALADAERAEKWRHECADVCSVLSKRLEELAGFLNSLLQHKDVLGVLAIDRRRAMRKAVDRSLDLSKSLNRTLSISGISLGEQSLAQLSNLSEILGDYECEEPSAHQQTLETLQAENKALKKELDKRRSTTEEKKKERRSLTHMIQYSESDSWSEPDRKVSMARMGLVEDQRNSGAAATAAAGATATTSTAAVVAAANASFVEKKLFQELLQEFGETQEQLKREQAANAQLKECNASLQADLMAIGGIMDSSNNPVKLADLAFEQQLAEQTHALQQLRDAHDRLQMEARCAELQIGALQNELAEQQQAKKLAEGATEQLRNETAQKMAAQERLHAEKLSRDWIERAIYEQTRQQLVDLQRQCLELERQVDTLHECETELKQTLMEQVQALRGCEKKLDESTLQASKAVTERTKALNEKLLMEKQLQKLQSEREMLHTQLAQLQRQLAQHKCQNNMQNNNKNQNSTKSNSLQMKHVGGGDSQSGYTSEEVILPSGAPGAVTAMATSVQRHNNSSPDLGIESDAGRVSSVELTSASHGQLKTVELAGSNIKEELSDGAEENMQPLTDHNNSNTANNNLNNGASSNGVVTTTTTTAAVAATTTTTNINHDCAKVEQENAELRRKLIRTKRAFEDTYEKLRVANQRKAQIEKDIKSQILKTHNVLKNVRSNMENEL